MTTELDTHRSPVNAEHYYGWKPGLWDQNNIPSDTAGLIILEQRDPRDEMPDPYDQLELGSCTGNALAGAVEYDAILNGNHFGTPSRLFIYWNEREIEGTIEEDSGAYGHDGFKVLRKIGVPSEDLWDYDITKFADKPPSSVFEAAGEHKIGLYTHPALNANATEAQRWAALQRVLSNRQTVAFGFTVYESFEGLQLERSGVMPMPGRNEKILGGHEVLLIGYVYHQSEVYALVRNSWGTEWGLGGYFLMPLQFLLNLQICNDFRTVRRPAGA